MKKIAIILKSVKNKHESYKYNSQVVSIKGPYGSSLFSLEGRNLAYTTSTNTFYTGWIYNFLGGGLSTVVDL